MKKAISVLGLGAVALVASAGVMAQTTGQTEVNGLVQAETCKIATESQNGVVKLDNVSASFVGDESNKKDFSINIDGCSANDRKVSLNFVDSQFDSNGYLENVAVNPAEGVGIAIYEKAENGDYRMFNLNDEVGQNYLWFQSIGGEVDGSGKLEYAANYVKTGDVKPGNVKGILKYKIIYR